MYLVPQGQNPMVLIAALEKRIIDLENMVKGLQSEPKARIGRPPKVKDEPNQPEGRDSSGD